MPGMSSGFQAFGAVQARAEKKVARPSPTTLLGKGVSPEGLEAYRHALPFAMNVTGLMRYWRTAGGA